MMDQETVARFAQDRQLSYTDFASMTRTQDVVDLINPRSTGQQPAGAGRADQELSHHLQQLDAEDEELTPTMKLKRKVVASRCADRFDVLPVKARQCPCETRQRRSGQTRWRSTRAITLS